MAGLLGSLHSAASGMTASQSAIQTTSHNINNMNTPGYSRQRADLSARRPYSQPGLNSQIGAGQVGTGVEVRDIKRIRNTFADYQFRSESHNYGSISIKYDYYKNMETIFNEPSDTSISSSLNNFFNSWHELSKDPNSVGAKNIAIENAKYLANNLNQVYKKLDSQQNNIQKQEDDIVNEINSMLESLQELEKNIKIVEATGKTPNDLLDQRDKILDDLSFKININDKDVQDALSDGKLDINELKNQDGSLKSGVSGELAGVLEMQDEIQSYKNQLEDLMQGIADGVNEIYNKGLSTETTTDIFEVGTDDNGNPCINVKQEYIDNPEKLEMTADKALELYNLKDKKIPIGPIGEDGKQKEMTINDFYNSVVQKLGHKTQEIIRNEKNQSQLLLSIDNSRLSVSGVSMDEEMINLIQYQHAYNASAKVISTIDSLLDVVINGLIR